MTLCISVTLNDYLTRAQRIGETRDNPHVIYFATRVDNPMNVQAFLGDVVPVIQATADTYRELFDPGVVTHPVPFFGHLDTAIVVTVGVNPAQSEFAHGRWPDSITTTDLSERLLAYFESGGTPHPWFTIWTQALAHLDLAYRSGQVAHVDVSPRATIPMGQTPNPNLFLSMLRHDVKWLFHTLAAMRNLRLILIAGSISLETRKVYLVDFLRECALRHGFTLFGEAQTKGRARVGYHEFRRQSGSIPAFFCSISPSATFASPKQLVERMAEHRDRLARIIRCEHPGWTSTCDLRLTSIGAPIRQ